LNAYFAGAFFQGPPQVTPEAIVFVISQPYVGARRLRLLADTLVAACPLPSALVRLEGVGPSLSDTLNRLRADGHRRILVQPVGLPFSDSLANWIPGALAQWQKHSGPDVEIAFGHDQAGDPEIAAAVARSALRSAPALPEVDARPALGKPGWDRVPPFRHHLLVCTGPRCHFHGAPTVRPALDAALEAEGIDDQVHVTQTGCAYPCNLGPLVIHYPAGNWYRLKDESAVRRFVKVALVAGETVSDLRVLDESAPGYPRAPASDNSQTT